MIWMDLEGIIQNKISQRKKYTVRSHLYLESKNKNIPNSDKKRSDLWLSEAENREEELEQCG